MSNLLHETKTNIDPEAEVKKLQDLVKKLERQNQVLRNKQNEREKERLPSVQNSLHIDNVENHDNEQLKTRLSNEETTTNGSERTTENSTSVLDIDILDLDEVEKEEDEDRCLYSSPKRPTASQRNVSPYQWVRSEFEHPSPEVESAKRSLLSKLDEVSCRMSRSSSAGTLGSLISPSSSSTLHTSPTSPSSFNSLSSAHQFTGNHTAPAIRHVPGLGSRIDTGTFTRPKKPRPALNSVHPPAESDTQDGVEIGSNNSSSNIRKSQFNSQTQINTNTFTRPKKKKVPTATLR